jgi:DNA polymerase-1
MTPKKRLFLLDAYALIFRGYYAMIKSPRIHSNGMETSAIYGFVNSLFDVINREKPDHLAVCFDKGGSHERTAAFEAYKANRSETPEAIKIAVPYIHQILEAMHIPIVEQEGMEADDLIGTLAKQAEKEGYLVYMVTPDKDFGQLVSEHILMYRPARMGNGIEIWGVPEVQERFGVQRPEQVIDYLGMMGDASDNIPGLPGVGDKTAKKFIETYGSMENLLAHAHELKGKMRENIEGAKELGMLSKQLATINTQCDVRFDAQNFELSIPDMDRVTQLFESLEFRRLKTQFDQLYHKLNGTASQTIPDTNKTPAPTSTAPTLPGQGQYSLFDAPAPATQGAEPATNFQRTHLAQTTHHYQVIQPGLGLKLLVETLCKQPSVCFDTETTSLNPMEAELVGISLSWEAHKAYFIPLGPDPEQIQGALEQLKPFFGSTQVEKIAHNLKYDLKVLKRYGVEVSAPWYDTMIAHYLINPDMRHNMDVLAETYLNYQPISYQDLVGKGKQELPIREVDPSLLADYACEDADITYQLAELFKKELAQAENTSLIEELELPLIDVLADMELAGISLNQQFLHQLSVELERDLKTLEQEIYQCAGSTFNIASPKQLGEILFEQLKLVDKPKKTKTGQYATSEEVLSYLAKDHEIVRKVLEYRGLAKLKSTYIDALPTQVDKKTNRIHTEYMQAVAATGRLSSNNPNLQNIPIRTERGREVRKAFVPKNDQYELMSADYSQIELRIIAALSEEDHMIEAFKQGADIHTATAAKLFGIPLAEVSKSQRSQAKTVNFGIIYGVSAFGLSNQTDLSRSEAKEMIETYYATYPKLNTYIQSQIAFAREHGYVQTVMGRRRYLKDINSSNPVVRGAAERNAVNAPIQGSAADIIKVAMIRIHESMKQLKLTSKMLLQVHDELVFEVYLPEKNQLTALIKKEMEGAYKCAVPLEVEIGSGSNWLEAH